MSFENGLETPAARPNVVLICVDQWRGDCLSIDGHPVVQTPYLDELALAGARFAHAYAATPSCVPARATLFTGLSQEHTGRPGYQDGIPFDYPTTLAGEFTRHGYQTQAIGKLHVYPERSQAGFQHVILHDGFLHFARRHHPDITEVDDYAAWLKEQLGPDADDTNHGLDCNSYVARPWDKPEHTHPTNYITMEAEKFLKRRDPRKPFFLYLSYHRPHPPLDPPAWAFEQYVDTAMPDPPVGDWAAIWDRYAQPHHPSSSVAERSAAVAQRARAGYYGHMSHIDTQVHRLVQALTSRNLIEDTVICFVSDHGDMLGDHHLWRKTVPYEGSARVPLILTGPASLRIVPGRVCEQVVELRDVMPTLLDCAGLPVPEGLDGVSLLPAAQGSDAPVHELIHGEHPSFGESLQWLTDGHEKYIWLSGSGTEQLFDLDRDPTELHDLASDPAHADRLAFWRQRLVEVLADREEGFSDGAKLIPGRTPKPTLDFLLARQREPVRVP